MIIRLTIFSLLFPTILFAQVIDNNTDIKVLSGRAAVNEFREAHDKQYVKGVKVIDIEDKLLSKMTWELMKAGHTGDYEERINGFFSLNDKYNRKTLGYSDEEKFSEDYEKNEELRSQYNSLWH